MVIRLLVLVLAAALLGCPPAAAVQPEARTLRAIGVLHAWDARREAAWGRSDEAALARLYAPGSTAARADVGLLRRYTARGLVVRRLRMQVFRVEVLASGRGHVVLRLVDRLAGGTVEGHGRCTLLDPELPRRHVVELRRTAEGWVMVRVGGAGPARSR